MITSRIIYILISIIALAIIAVIVILRIRKKEQKPLSTLAALAFSLIIAGIVFVIIFFIIFSIISCSGKYENSIDYKVSVIREIEHEGDRIFTQGFEIYNGKLYESTGLRSESCIKIINLETGNIIKQINTEKAIPESNYFGEGITIHNDEIIQLTWRGKKALIYTTALEIKDESFTYNTEGWGITHNDKYYIMSDGSKYLYFRDFETFEVINKLYVGVKYLNELEYVDGIIYANVWTKDYIIMIDESTGEIIGKIDAGDLLCCQSSRSNTNAVLNGIAYNKETKTFYITGKECPIIYEATFQPE